MRTNVRNLLATAAVFSLMGGGTFAYNSGLLAPIVGWSTNECYEPDDSGYAPSIASGDSIGFSQSDAENQEDPTNVIVAGQTYSWESTNKEHGSQSDVTYTICAEEDALLTFDWSVSSERGCDVLYVEYDGNNVVAGSGEDNGSVTCTVTKGTHTLYARYSKDGSVNSGLDKATITNLCLRNMDLSDVTADNPLGMTNWIVNPSYNNGSNGWEGRIGNVMDNVAENWNTNFEFHQTIAGLPNGYYRVNVKGFYRAGSLEESYAAYKVNNNGVLNSFVYAKSGENISSVAMQNIAAGATPTNNYDGREMADGTYVPNDMYSSSCYMAYANKYQDNSLICHVVDSTLTIGIKKTELIEDDWTIFDDWSLEYLGTDDAISVTPDYYTVGKEIYFNTAMSELKEAIDNYNSETTPENIYNEANELYVTLDEKGYVAEDASTDIASIYQAIEKLSRVYLTIDVGNASGTLGDRILSMTNSLQDVVYLSVSGKLNKADFNIVKGLVNLRGVDLGGVTGVKTMDSEFFYEHKNIESVILPQSLTVIPSEMFWMCHKLTNVVIPESVTEIERYAFHNCDNLKEIKLPEGLLTIRDGAFDYCYALQRVSFPESLTTIENYAFAWCNALENITLPSSLKEIQYDAFRNTAITSIVIPEGVQKLDSYTFAECYNLKSVTLPSTMQYMNNAFYGCYAIETVYSNSLVPAYQTIANGFGSSANAVLYAPEFSLNRYKQAVGWTVFADYRPLPIYPEDITVACEATFAMPDSIPSDWKPSLTLTRTAAYDENMGINPYGALTVYNTNEASAPTFSLKSFNMVWDPNIEYDYYWSAYDYGYRLSSVLVNKGKMRADSVSVTFYKKNNRWTYFTLPFNARMSDIADLYPNQFKSIRKYSGENRAAATGESNWIEVGENDVLEAGIGYVIQSSWRYEEQADGYTRSYDWSGFVFQAINDAKKNNIFTSDNVAITLEEFTDVDTKAHNRSWNFVGNPYPAYYDIRFMETEAPITVWNQYENTYETYTTDDAFILAPGEAFFIQRPLDGSLLTLSAEGRQIDRTKRDVNEAPARNAQASGRSIYNLTLTDGEQTDRTRFVINEQARADYEIGRDAAKFMSEVAEASQLYTVAGDVNFSINERPLADGTVQLAAKFAKAGQYTIGLSAKNATHIIYIEDKLTGEFFNLSESEEGYTFTASEGIAATRFVIHAVATDDATAIATLNSAAAGSNYDAIYTVDGRKVGQATKPGIYLMRNGSKVTKVMVK